jgi:hypothetical protein
MNQYDRNPVNNESWGASINNLPPTIFLIYFQNVNGLQYKTTNSRWQPHLDFMKEIKEYHLVVHKHLTRQIRANACNIFKTASVVFSKNSFNPPDWSHYLPGGTLQICTDHWTARIIETIHNPCRMGRWVGLRYRLKEGKTLSIITAYRPAMPTIQQ